MARSSLFEFDLEESPDWRSSQQLTSSIVNETSENIRECHRLLSSLPEDTRKDVQQRIDHQQMVTFVLVSNVGENVGTQTYGDTETALSTKAPLGRKRSEEETVNTSEALKLMKSLIPKDSIEEVFLPQNLKSIHSVLLRHDTEKTPGQFRDRLVYTDCKGPDGAVSEEFVIRGLAKYAFKIENAESKDYNQLCKEVAKEVDADDSEEESIIKKCAELLKSFGDNIMQGSNHEERLKSSHAEIVRCEFESNPLSNILFASDKTTESVLRDLSKEFGLSISEPPTVREAAAIHQCLIEKMHCYTYVYPLYTEGMIEDLLFILHGEVKKRIEECKNEYPSKDFTDIDAISKAIKFLAKVAAYALFEFVDLHPFCDGNGRMARLVACAIMSSVMSFPCGLTCEERPTNATYREYVKAIVQARKDPERKPVSLATLAIEGAYYSSQIAVNNIKDYLKLGIMTWELPFTAEDRPKLIKKFLELDHSRRAEAPFYVKGDLNNKGECIEKDIEGIIEKMQCSSEEEEVTVEFSDNFFVTLHLML